MATGSMNDLPHGGKRPLAMFAAELNARVLRGQNCISFSTGARPDASGAEVAVETTESHLDPYRESPYR
jgi:hypothetical protein